MTAFQLATDAGWRQRPDLGGDVWQSPNGRLWLANNLRTSLDLATPWAPPTPQFLEPARDVL